MRFAMVSLVLLTGFLGLVLPAHADAEQITHYLVFSSRLETDELKAIV